MPSFDYNKMYQCAEDLILSAGGTGTITKTTFTVPDSTKLWERTPSESTVSVTMVITPWSSGDEKRYFNEDIIAATTKGIILWPESDQLKVDDKITYQGRDWMVVAQKPIKPAAKGLIYVCALSGGEE